MSNFSKLIKIKKLPGSSKMIKWYSMIECEAQIDSEKYIVPLPASFLNQIGIDIKGVSINDNDFIIDNNQYILEHENELRENFKKRDFGESQRYDLLHPFMPYTKTSLENEIDKIKGYWASILPEYLVSDELFKKLHKIIRIASCACIFSCYEGKKIYGIRDIIDLYLEGNWISLSPASTNIFNIREAVLGKGKIIGPLHAECYFTGWEIISMIYAMIWSNSNIKNDEKELFFLIKVLSNIANIDGIDRKSKWYNKLKEMQDMIVSHNKDISFKRCECKDLKKIIKEQLTRKEMSAEAWIILFLYIRNLKWHYDYINNLMTSFEYKNFVNVDWEKLYVITQECMPDIVNQTYSHKRVSVDKMKELITNGLASLQNDKYKLVTKIILDKDFCEKKNDNQNKISYRLENAIILWKFAAKTLMKDSHTVLYLPYGRYEVDNIFFWILVELKIYSTFLRVKLPTSNNLDFIRKAGEYSTYSKDSIGSSVVSLKKGMKNIKNRHREEDFYRFFPYLYIYLPLTKYIRQGIVNHVNIKIAYDNQKKKMGLIYSDLNNLLKCLNGK